MSYVTFALVLFVKSQNLSECDDETLLSTVNLH